MRGQRTRGASLIEAMVAMVVVCVATASITTLLKYVGDASRRMTFQTASLDVYAEVVAQIQDARCNVSTTGAFDLDPGLNQLINVTAPNTWISTPATMGNSLIRTLGDLQPTAAAGSTGRAVPLNVAIRFLPGAPFAFLTSVGPPSYDFEIRIREITGDPVRDAPALNDGYWIRVYPAKKVCNFRNDGTSRGEAY